MVDRDNLSLYVHNAYIYINIYTCVPIGSMYDIFTYTYHKKSTKSPNLGIDTYPEFFLTEQIELGQTIIFRWLNGGRVPLQDSNFIYDASNHKHQLHTFHTVDGSDIRRSPGEVGSLSH